MFIYIDTRRLMRRVLNGNGDQYESDESELPAEINKEFIGLSKRD